jgi:hypothetical protein
MCVQSKMEIKLIDSRSSRADLFPVLGRRTRATNHIPKKACVPQPWSDLVYPYPFQRWTCDKKVTTIEECANQDIVDKVRYLDDCQVIGIVILFLVQQLSELMAIHRAKPSKDDHWRAFAYSKGGLTIRCSCIYLTYVDRSHWSA